MTATSKKGSRRTVRGRRNDRTKRGLAEGYRSGLEEQQANELKDAGTDFLFEAYKIPYIVPARKATYKPDFILRKDRGIIQPLPDNWFKDEQWNEEHFIVETKGRFMTADRQKHLMIRDQLPLLDIRFVFSRSKSPLYKGSPTTYAMWSEKKGFQYADKRIPDDWFI